MSLRKLRTARKGSREKGLTLLELTVVVTIMGVLAMFGVPKFDRALEESRVRFAKTQLEILWTAQRVYWLTHKKFTSNLYLLKKEGLLTPASLKMLEKNCMNCSFRYTIRKANGVEFRAEAQRIKSKTWKGEIQIDQNGTLIGSIKNQGSSYVIHPDSL